MHAALAVFFIVTGLTRTHGALLHNCLHAKAPQYLTDYCMAYACLWHCLSARFRASKTRTYIHTYQHTDFHADKQ